MTTISTAFIDFSYFRLTFEAEILNFFTAESIQSITDTQILTYLQETASAFSVTESQLAEFEFFSQVFEADLLAQFSVNSLSEISFADTFQFFLGQGLAENSGLSFFIDLDYFRRTFSAQLISFFNATTLEEISLSQTFNYILNVGIDSGLNPSPFIDLEFYRTTFATELIAFFGAASITEISFSQVFEYLTTVGLEQGNSPSALIDLSFVREQFDDELRDFFGGGDDDDDSAGDDDDDDGAGNDDDDDDSAGDDDDDDDSAGDDDDDDSAGDDDDDDSADDDDVDDGDDGADSSDGDGGDGGDVNIDVDIDITTRDIFQFLVVAGDELELDTSPLFDFQYYVSTFSAELIAFYQVTSIEEITFQQIYEYALTVGLEQGFQTSLTADFEFYREVYAAQLVAFYGVASVTELTSVQILNFIATESVNLPGLVATEDNLLVLGGQTVGESVELQVSLTSNQNNILGELGVFVVQDEQGGVDIDGDGVIDITPEDADYAQTVLGSGNAEVIFSVLPDTSELGLIDLQRLVEGFASGDRLAFYLIEGSTTDAVLSGQVSAELVTFASTFGGDLFDDLDITDLGAGVFSLDWTDIGIEIAIEATSATVTVGADLQGQQEAEILDFTDFDGQQVEIDVLTANSDAAFDNTVGFYRIEDTSGAVRDPLTGQLVAPTDQENYAQAAIRQSLEAAQGFSFDENGTGAEFTLSGGDLFAPFIIANGTIDEFLTDNPTNDLGEDVVAYFGIISANPDGADHVRLLGDNTFGFEDLPNGGDQDFNDFVYKLGVTVV